MVPVRLAAICFSAFLVSSPCSRSQSMEFVMEKQLAPVKWNDAVGRHGGKRKKNNNKWPQAPPFLTVHSFFFSGVIMCCAALLVSKIRS